MAAVPTVPAAPGLPAAPSFDAAHPAHDDSSTAVPIGRDEPSPRRAAAVQRVLEIVPGLVTWALILSPLILSVRVPEVVAWAVLSFDFYWLYKALMLTGSVVVTFLRIKGVEAVDWRSRVFALADLPGRREVLDRLIPAFRQRIAELERSGERLAAKGGRRELARLREERKQVERLLARRTPIPDPRRLWHVALIPTYTEQYEKLEATVRALAEADYPRNRKMVAIITRETDLTGRANVARLREVFGDRFLHFFHVLDPLEPGIVVGKSSAMAYGGRWLYRAARGSCSCVPLVQCRHDLFERSVIRNVAVHVLVADHVARPDHERRAELLRSLAEPVLALPGGGHLEDSGRGFRARRARTSVRCGATRSPRPRRLHRGARES